MDGLSYFTLGSGFKRYREEEPPGVTTRECFKVLLAGTEYMGGRAGWCWKDVTFKEDNLRCVEDLELVSRYSCDEVGWSCSTSRILTSQMLNRTMVR
jgi:hypothetical protein